VRQRSTSWEHFSVRQYAFLSSSPRYIWQAFFEELRRLGDVEGQNLAVERYSGEGRPERLAYSRRRNSGIRWQLIERKKVPPGRAEEAGQRFFASLAHGRAMH